MTGARVQKSTIASAALAILGVYQLMLGLYFVFLRPSFLPEDLRYADSSRAALQSSAPHLEAWLQWVFAVMGGQMIAVGALLLPLAIKIGKAGKMPKSEVLGVVVCAGASAVSMSAVNFAIGSDFRWVLIAPVILWICALSTLPREAQP